ncbi:MAG: response regulator transcription factor [Planctomycetota bacterium]
MDPITVYLVDDQRMIRAAFRALLEENERFRVVGDDGDARAAIETIASVQPDVVLLDITMPGLSGIDAIPRIREASPRTKVVMLTHHEGQTFVEQALKAGAERLPVEGLARRRTAAGDRGGAPRRPLRLVQGLRRTRVAGPRARATANVRPPTRWTA